MILAFPIRGALLVVGQPRGYTIPRPHVWAPENVPEESTGISRRLSCRQSEYFPFS
jgi:hypothetical protein